MTKQIKIMTYQYNIFFQIQEKCGQLEDLGKCYELPSEVRSRAPDAKAFLAYFRVTALAKKFTFSVPHFKQYNIKSVPLCLFSMTLDDLCCYP